MNKQTLFVESLPVQQLLLTPYVPVCVCGDKVCVCVCVVWEEGGWWCIKVGGRVDRVSGTKPPPKINSVPVSLSLCMSSCRPAGSHSSSNSSSRDKSGARRPVTGTTCHQLHHSPNGSPLDQRHGRQCVAPPRRQFILHARTHAHVHKHSCTHKHSCCRLPSTNRPALERLGGPLMKTCRSAGDNVYPDLWSHARLPS